MRVECEDHHTPARDNQYRATARYYKDACPYCEIDRLKTELEDGQQERDNLRSHIYGLREAVDGLESEPDRYKSKYHNLLAVAHRDGGHYLQEHGEEKAGEDAITAILAAYHNNDSYLMEVE